VQTAPDIIVERQVEYLVRHLRQRDAASIARHVDQYVDPACRVDGAIHQRRKIRPVLKVARDRNRLDATRLDQRNGLVQRPFLLDRLSRLRAVTTTVAPADARRRAAARPIPRLAPVISAILPGKRWFRNLWHNSLHLAVPAAIKAPKVENSGPLF
jgi:hypothetical protein